MKKLSTVAMETAYLAIVDELAAQKNIGPTELARRAWPHQMDAARKLRLVRLGKIRMSFQEAAMLAGILHEDFAQLVFAAQSRAWASGLRSDPEKTLSQ